MKKTKFVGPFHGNYELNAFIDIVEESLDIKELLMDGYLNTAFITFNDNHVVRYPYEVIEIGYY